MKAITHVKINNLLAQIDETMSYINRDIENNLPKKDFESNVKWDELCIIRDTIISCTSKIKKFNKHNVLSKD